MSMRRWSIAVCAVLLGSYRVAAYSIIREYAGSTFFDGWDFYGSWDNLTLGNVTYVTQADAQSLNLAYVNSQGHAIIKVDNTTNVTMGETRNSVRITTKDAYDFGSLWIIDLNHIPYGCSVWPAFWSFGSNWPFDGEIDIVEGINLNTNNQMAIHTTEGCFHYGNTDQLGYTGSTDCSQGSGCTVGESSPNSFYTGFADAGGGVWATQFDITGIYIWFWSRTSIPPSIGQATSTSSMNISGWGIPHAAFTNTNCNITQFFTPQNLVLNIDLCGDWAGVPSIYDSQCANAGPTGLCYNDCVVGPGSPRYDNAYFDVNYVRTYTTSAAVPASTGTASKQPGSAGSPTGQPAPTSAGIRIQGELMTVTAWLAISAAVAILTYSI